ncbi:hypothetical protein ACS6JK_12040 [Enterobacter chuandaensis]|uniref:hypothetical protein n=1 Tax=Enterobacter chuandaensis TaxID=2497875 RepID=UPI00292FB24C
MINIENPDHLKIRIYNAIYEEGNNSDFITHVWFGNEENGVNLQANGKKCSYKKKNYRFVNSPVVTIINDSSLNLRPYFSVNGSDFFAAGSSIIPNGIRMFTGDSGTWKKQGVRHGDNLKVKFSYALAEPGSQKEVICPSLDSLTENQLYRLQGGEQNALCALESNEIQIKNDRIQKANKAVRQHLKSVLPDAS